MFDKAILKKLADSALKYAAENDEYYIQSKFNLSREEARRLRTQATAHLKEELATDMKRVVITREDHGKLLKNVSTSCLSAKAKAQVTAWLKAAKPLKAPKAAVK